MIRSRVMENKYVELNCDQWGRFHLTICKKNGGGELEWGKDTFVFGGIKGTVDVQLKVDKTKNSVLAYILGKGGDKE